MRCIHVVAALTAVTGFATPNAFADTFADDFAAGIRSGLWTVKQTTDGQYAVDDTHGDVRLSRINPSSPGGVQNVGLYLNLNRFGGPVQGDFSAQVDFHNANVSLPGLNQVELHTNFANGQYLFVVFDNNYGAGLNAHVWDGGYHNAIGTTATAGTFRIARTGTTVTGYFNATAIFSFNCGSDLTDLSFVLQNNIGGASLISVTFDNFSMTATNRCPADFNADGFIDIYDFTDFVDCFEGAACPPGKSADFNSDGFADIYDFTDFVDAFELGC